MSLDSAEIAQLHGRLLEMLAETEDAEHKTKSNRETVQLDQQAVGRLSRMDAMQQQAMSNAQQSRRSIVKVRIKNALDRMSDGEFGFCLDCGESIERKRLEFDPTTPLCASCTKG